MISIVWLNSSKPTKLIIIACSPVSNVSKLNSPFAPVDVPSKLSFIYTFANAIGLFFSSITLPVIKEVPYV